MTVTKLESKDRLAERRRDALDALYDEIVARTDSQRRLNSLKNLYETLRHLLSVKSSATSVAAVARAVHSLGHTAPKAQSIRNVEGKDFRDLIAAYTNLSDDRKSGAPSDDDKLVGDIEDLKIAAQVRWLLNENRSLKRRLDLLHAQFQKIEPIRLLAAGLPSDDAGSERESHGLTKIEIDAVRQFRSNLPDIDCVIDETSGALLYREKLEIAPPGFGQALVKLTGKPTN